MSLLKNKPLTKLLDPFIYGKWSKQPENRYLCCFFLHFGAIWAPLNGPKKVPKNPQVGGGYGPMSKLKNKPLAKLLGPFI
jgi:hypothetical protein